MSEDVDALLAEARRLIKQRDLPAARSAAERACAAEPSAKAAHTLLASVAFMAKDYPKAAECFETVSRLDPRDGVCLVNLGAVRNRMGLYKEAVNVLQKAVVKVRGDGNGYYNLGVAYRGLGQSSMAISAYREALRLDPENADAHLNLANIFVEMNNYPQAVLHYQKALQIRPNFDRAQKGLNHAMSLSSEAKEAESPFGRLVDRDRKQKGDAELRTLTPDEQLKDRHALRLLTGEVRSATNDFVTHIREQLLPALLKLNRNVSQVTDDPYSVEDAFRQYQAAVEENRRLRKLMKRKMLEIRAHEEIMNTPDLPDDLLRGSQ